MNSELHDALQRAFSRVAALGGPNQFNVSEVGGHYAGRDNLGQLALLIRAQDASSRAPIRLALVDVRFSMDCRIVTGAGAEHTETLTAVTCASADDQLRSYFIFAAETLLRIIGPSPTIKQIAEAVHHLIELFQKLSRPAARSTMGLFGELFVIAMSADPKTVVRAWRSEMDERFDFATGNLRVEVKASGKQRTEVQSPAGHIFHARARDDGRRACDGRFEDHESSVWAVTNWDSSKS